MPDKFEALIPEGMWVMKPERSKRLVPGTHTLWIVKNDGRALIFASVETDIAGEVKLTSWQGDYDGPAVEVVGSGMMASLSAPAPREMLITGEIPGMGVFSEHCIWSPESNTLVCRGRVETPDGLVEYLDADAHSLNWLGHSDR
jgi:hypothetical protein